MELNPYQLSSPNPLSLAPLPLSLSLSIPPSLPPSLLSAAGLREVKEKVKPYDWTYTTCYRGNVEGLEVAETDAKIDYEHLKQQERIEFYDEVVLYEDELADNGTALLNVKVVSEGRF